MMIFNINVQTNNNIIIIIILIGASTFNYTP